MSDFSPVSIQDTYHEEKMKVDLCLKQKWQEILLSIYFLCFQVLRRNWSLFTTNNG